jgi:uroporphyrinogen decarboxylase
MTSKERFFATLRRQPVDRPCVDYEALPEVTDALCARLGLPDLEALRVALGSDLRNLVSAAPYVGEPFPPQPDGAPRDYFGAPDSQGTYSSNLYQPPLAHAETVADVEAHRWPDPADFDYSGLRSLCESFSPYVTCGGAWSPMLCTAMHLTGMEEFFALMASRPAVAEAILEHLCEFFHGYSRRYFEATRGALDVFFMGDDFGLQTGPMFSLAMFRRFLVPRLARLYGLAKDYGLTVMMHSCGGIRPFIPDMIAAGMDVLDPVQVRAEGMDVEGLRREFGRDLTFHGSIDTQQTLPFGSPADVAAEVRARLELFGDEGGFICCGSQHYLPDIPLDNLLTIYRTCGTTTL